MKTLYGNGLKGQEQLAQGNALGTRMRLGSRRLQTTFTQGNALGTFNYLKVRAVFAF